MLAATPLEFILAERIAVAWHIVFRRIVLDVDVVLVIQVGKVRPVAAVREVTLFLEIVIGEQVVLVKRVFRGFGSLCDKGLA